MKLIQGLTNEWVLVKHVLSEFYSFIITWKTYVTFTVIDIPTCSWRVDDPCLYQENIHYDEVTTVFSLGR